MSERTKKEREKDEENRKREQPQAVGIFQIKQGGRNDAAQCEDKTLYCYRTSVSSHSKLVYSRVQRLKCGTVGDGLPIDNHKSCLRCVIWRRESDKCVPAFLTRVADQKQAGSLGTQSHHRSPTPGCGLRGYHPFLCASVIRSCMAPYWARITTHA